MWPRVVELMLAVWLALSPFVFRYGPEAPAAWWGLDFGVSIVVLAASGISFWHRARRAHLVTLATGLGIAIHGYVAGGHPSPPGMQNHLVTGLLLAMLAILPSQGDVPPARWVRSYAEGGDA